MRKALLTILLLGIFGSVSAQTVVTQTYATPAACGTAHSGPPIVLCSVPGNSPISFVLGGNITATTTDAIDITGDDITLDLNGYAVKGSNSAGCPVGPPGNSCTTGSGGYGINVSARHVTIKNGTVANVSNSGITYTAGLANSDLHLDHLLVHDNRGYGVIAGDNTTVSDVQASANAQDGISIQSGIISSSSAFFNNGRGFSLVVQGGTLLNSVSQYNVGAGVGLSYGGLANGVASGVNGSSGFQLLGSSVVNSTAFNNSSDGINSIGGSGSVWNTEATQNGGFGFNLSSTTCYTDVTTVSNFGGTLTGGTAMGSTSLCAH